MVWFGLRTTLKHCFLFLLSSFIIQPGKLTNASGTFDVEFAAFTSRWQMPLNGRCVKRGEGGGVKTRGTRAVQTVRER